MRSSNLLVAIGLANIAHNQTVGADAVEPRPDKEESETVLIERAQHTMHAGNGARACIRRIYLAGMYGTMRTRTVREQSVHSPQFSPESAIRGP